MMLNNNLHVMLNPPVHSSFKEEGGFEIVNEKAGSQRIKTEKDNMLLESWCPKSEEDREIKPPLQMFIQSNNGNEGGNCVKDHPVEVFDVREDTISPDHGNNNVGTPFSNDGIRLTANQNLQFSNEIYSGFSIFKTSTKQAQETYKNVLNVKKPAKSGAERIREHRARKKALQDLANKHLTSSEYVVNQETYKNVLTVKKPPKTGAERNREYRARKKARLANKHLAGNEYIVDQETCKNILTVKKQAKTSAERNREYRARKKARLANKHLTSNEYVVNQELLQDHLVGDEVHIHENNHPLLYEYLSRRNSFSNQGNTYYQSIVHAEMHQQSSPLGYHPINSVQEQSISKNVSKTSKKTPKTSAERCREYRLRQKAKNVDIHHQVTCNTSPNSVPPKTSAERSRKYRLHQKALKSVDIHHQVTCKSSYDIVPNDVECLVYQKSPQNSNITKTSAERSRKYRLRQKAVSLKNEIIERLSRFSSQTDVSNNVSAVNREPIIVTQQDLINNILNTPSTSRINHSTNVPQINELCSDIHHHIKAHQQF